MCFQVPPANQRSSLWAFESALSIHYHLKLKCYAHFAMFGTLFSNVCCIVPLNLHAERLIAEHMGHAKTGIFQRVLLPCALYSFMILHACLVIEQVARESGNYMQSVLTFTQPKIALMTPA